MTVRAVLRRLDRWLFGQPRPSNVLDVLAATATPNDGPGLLWPVCPTCRARGVPDGEDVCWECELTGRSAPASGVDGPLPLSRGLGVAGVDLTQLTLETLMRRIEELEARQQAFADIIEEHRWETRQ